MESTTLINSFHLLSEEYGIISRLYQAARLNGDPKILGYGIRPANTEYISHEKYAGKSAGCGFNWQDAILSTIGETVERYAPAFQDQDNYIFSSYKELSLLAIHPSQFALFHDEQFKEHVIGKYISKFSENTEITWVTSNDLTNGKETLLPAQLVYMPFRQDKNHIALNVSTGLAAHTNFHKAILNGLFETIERDSFVITWFQKLVPHKIVITKEIQSYIDQYFPTKYEWHFFDISYDLKTPTIFGICFGEAEYGKFVAIGASTRFTYGEALKKTIQEIGQSVPFFRLMLHERKDKGMPDDDYGKIKDFDDHSWFYLKRHDMRHVFDRWVLNVPSKVVQLYEENNLSDIEQVRSVVQILKDKGYNVLVKDLTTPDLRQAGFFSVKVIVPQLTPLSGAYSLYNCGGNRLYEVPKMLGFTSNDFYNLNKFPHPFP